MPRKGDGSAPQDALAFDVAVLRTARGVLRVALRALLVFGLVGGVLIGALWSAKHWGWKAPSPLDALFLEHEQKAEALLYAYDNATGWKPNAHTQLHYLDRGPFQRGEPRDVRLKTNGDGFFDREHYLSTPYYRVAFLGDSWVEAQQVEASQRFTELVETYVFSLSNGRKAVETMNFGVSNLGTAQEYGVVKAYVLKYRPDEIWIVFNVNDDFTDSSPLFTPPPLGPTFVLSSTRAQGDFADIRFGYVDPPVVAEARRRERYGEWVTLALPEVAAYLYAEEAHPAFDTISRETRYALRLLKRLADGIGAKLVLLYLPARREFDTAAWTDYEASVQRSHNTPLHLDVELAERRVEAMAREEGAAFLSLKRLMREKGSGEMLQAHLSRMGHHWVADFIARHFVEADCCALPAGSPGAPSSSDKARP